MAPVLIQGLLVTSLVLSGAPAAGAKARVDCAKVTCLALTFDDGPGPRTGALLDVLKRERVHATFFLMGKHVEQLPKVVRRTMAEGHAIGNHTYSHPSLPTLLDQEIIDEIRLTQDAIQEVTGRRPRMFRPPYGNTDDRVLRLAGSQDLSQVLWTGTTLDWKLRDPARIKAAVLRLAKPNGVILMHDTVPQTVQAMPEILKELKKRGYHLVTVPTLLGGRTPDAGVSFP
ncbi:polysaccharide deacetylase family protein [Nonomuraea rhodomycinica]|uniref:Polysaccharide deacetylase family protein n=1 Tax=Nonomuraea rhodomycinica TaxID=1712872 RepID=A0A7Y6IM85_9ACTN|nr:polysaccharide deacetylase family protein [Nonomuraea rhodomycinica]